MIDDSKYRKLLSRCFACLFFFFLSSVARFREQRKDVAQSPQIAREMVSRGMWHFAPWQNSRVIPRCVFSLQTQNEEDPFYTGCHITKNCFGAPAGCIKTKDCAAVVAVIVQGDEYHFELQARREAKYVAVGLSDDKNMVIARGAALQPSRIAFSLGCDLYKRELANKILARNYFIKSYLSQHAFHIFQSSL